MHSPTSEEVQLQKEQLQVALLPLTVICDSQVGEPLP